AGEGDAPAREFYELRRYRLRITMRQRFSDHLRDEALPAWNRAGISPVGVFTVAFGPDNPTFYVLLPHASLSSVHEVEQRLQADAAYQTAFQRLPSGDPGFVRMDSQLMVAFAGMPRLEKPQGAMAGASRIFELRTYESHSVAAHLKKVEMFDRGEIDIFRRTGLTPVFFGSNLVGPNLPSLTYLLVFENMAARERNWAQFVNHPDWKTLAATPGYTDAEIVSTTHSFILRPTAYSQI
ncbi:MAG TPA: NIPSNAP family protein, partial [Vicinamibacterales bacterium]